MTCVFFTCAGSGVVSRLFSLLISVVMTFHVVGLLSPHWMCDHVPGTSSCDLQGLYYTCVVEECEGSVLDDAVLTLVLIVFISSFTLNLVLCLILNCSTYRFKSMSPCLALFIGGWYLAQEMISVAVLIVLNVKYDKIGWSAYVFLLPGIVGMLLVFIIVVYMACFPSSKVKPSL